MGKMQIEVITIDSPIKQYVDGINDPDYAPLHYSEGLSSVLPIRLGELVGASLGGMPDTNITMDVSQRTEDGKSYAFRVDSDDDKVAYFTDSPIDGKVTYNPSLLIWEGGA